MPSTGHDRELALHRPERLQRPLERALQHRDDGVVRPRRQVHDAADRLVAELGVAVAVAWWSSGSPRRRLTSRVPFALPGACCAAIFQVAFFLAPEERNVEPRQALQVLRQRVVDP